MTTPLQNVLSVLRAHEVPHLLMGGQACILYGAGEFSRDLDLVIATDRDSFARLQTALTALHVTTLYVPPLDLAFLDRGHVVHLACQREGGFRLDICTRPPRIKDAIGLWNRAQRLSVPDGEVRVLALPDLIATKKTKRDKDWPIIGRLIEVDMMVGAAEPTADRLALWLRECRDATTLAGLAAREPELAATLALERPVLAAALNEEINSIELALAQEQIEGKREDEAYWSPLLEELEQMRHDARKRP